MKVTHLFCAALVLSAAQATAQDTRAKTLPLPKQPPPSRAPAVRAPVVADAAMKGDLAAVRKAVQQGADVNVAQGDGMTALHWAADHGDSAMTELLVKAHANVNATTRDAGYTPLQLASRKGSAGVVRSLLKAGADAKAVSASGATVLHLAAQGGSGDVVAALIEKGADANAREPEYGQTPLVFAAEAGRAAAVQALLKHGADVNMHTVALNLTEQTARDQAAARKRQQILLSFLPEKVRDSIHTVYVKDSTAAALQAAQNPGGFRGGGGGGGGGGARMNLPYNMFTSAQFQAAIDSGRAAMANAATAKGPVTEEVDTLNGGVAGFLGSVGGIGGLTALHHAVRQGNLAAVVALLDGGADINDQSQVDHTTPLVMATINGQFDVAMKLIERGANPNIVTTHGMTALYGTINTQWAPRSRYPQPQALQYQKTTYLEVMEALLKAGASPNARLQQQPWYFAYNNCGNANCGLENIEGTTAFWRAAYGVDVEAMKLLVKYGADPNIPSQRMQVADAGRGGRGGGRGGRGGRAGAPGDSAQATGGRRAGAPGAPGDSAQVAGGRGVAFAAAGGGGGGGGRGGGGPPPPPEIAALAAVAPVGAGVLPIHCAAGVGYGNGYAGNSHRHAPDGWLPAMKYLVEELHADVNARDPQGMTPLFHAAARGDNEMILYLVSKGADVKAVSRTGRTTVDMANGPVSRITPIPSTIALLEKLGAVNTHRCASC
jgi:ankyrin repeat protein